MPKLTLLPPLRSAALLVALPFIAATPHSGSRPAPAPPLPTVANAAPASGDEVAAPKKPEPAPVAPREIPKLARRGTQRILEVEARLAELGYWTGPVDGILDPASQLALVAFQKVEGRPRTGRITADEHAALMAAERPRALEGGPAHVEVDISRQVLFFVGDDGEVDRAIAVSTGNNKDYVFKGVRDRAYTPRGRWTVYRKILGMRRAPLGDIFYPSYLVGGIAIHGSPSIPPYPASHGCVRVPMWAAKEISERVPAGAQVLIHDAGSFENDDRWLTWASRARPDGYVPATNTIAKAN